MLLFSLAVVFGLIFLVLSADRFVNSSVALAKDLGVSPFMIGMTIIAFGTSAPELVVSATAAFSGVSALAIGNAIGSNIANIGLVLGITCLITSIPIHISVVKKELPLLTIMTIIVGILLYNGLLSRLDSLILYILLLISLFLISRGGEETENLIEEVEETPSMPPLKASLTLLIGLIILLISAKLLVWGASGIARHFGVSELIIGLTIVAIGTSLPELAASVVSALKGHKDMALGNIIGSNLFNLLAVLPLPGLIKPVILEQSVMHRDYPVMMVYTIALLIISLIIRWRTKKPNFGKITGAVLIISYIGYLVSLYQAATLT
jgi:cation:H+ antiporter